MMIRFFEFIAEDLVVLKNTIFKTKKRATWLGDPPYLFFEMPEPVVNRQSSGINSRNSRQFAAFEIFEHGPAAGGNIADLIGITELVNRSYRIAAAHQ